MNAVADKLTVAGGVRRKNDDGPYYRLTRKVNGENGHGNIFLSGQSGQRAAGGGRMPTLSGIG
jgi:hypothetical protein